MTKWANVEAEPAQRRTQISVRKLAEELRAEPGRWAEVGRYTSERRTSAWSRGSTICMRYPGLEYAVKPDGAEYVLYLRAAPAVP